MSEMSYMREHYVSTEMIIEKNQRTFDDEISFNNSHGKVIPDISHHIWLKKVSIQMSFIEDIMPRYLPPSITSLDCRNAELHSINFNSEDYPNLKILNISSNPIKELTCIPKSLTELHATSTPRNSTRGHRVSLYESMLPNIEKLILFKSNFLKYPDFSKLENLLHLDIDNCNINLDEFILPSKIIKIEATNNKFKILNIKSCKSLKEIIIRKSEIEEIVGDFSSELTTIDLSFNELSVLSSIEHCGELIKLDVCNNKLEKIDIIEFPHKLNMIDLSNNQLPEIPSMEHCSELMKLDVSNNKLKTLPLINKNKLISIDIHANCFPSDYKPFTPDEIKEFSSYNDDNTIQEFENIVDDDEHFRRVIMNDNFRNRRSINLEDGMSIGIERFMRESQSSNRMMTMKYEMLSDPFSIIYNREDEITC
jgi:Leucine-rich repeat (LRR) protein